MFWPMMHPLKDQISGYQSWWGWGLYFLNMGCHVSSGTAWSLDVVLVVVEKSNNQENNLWQVK